jgi:hypothetical protein
VTGTVGPRGSRRARGAGGSRSAAAPSPAAAPEPVSQPTGGDRPVLDAPRLTDANSRVAVWERGPQDWPDFTVDGGDTRVRPIVIIADYRGTAEPGGRIRWVTNVHVTGQVYGKSGRLVDSYRSAWFTQDTHPDDWPYWILHEVEHYHPDRGGPGVDPEGSYL